jgi:hypothetical protein
MGISQSLILKPSIMNKIILTLAFASLCLLNYAQENTRVKATELFSKAKKQKTAAWICVGAGATIAIIGVIIGTRKAEDDLVSVLSFEPTQHDYTSANVLLVVGGTTALASIPLFIAAGRNNQKARLMITNQKTSFGVPKGSSKSITGLTLAVSL